MKLEGYRIEEVKPWEAASGGRAVECPVPMRACAASFRYEGKPGWYDVSVQYFDQNNGTSRFKLFIAGQLVNEWAADDVLPTSKMDAHSSTRRKVTGLALRPGDAIRIAGFPDGGEGAPIDYLEIRPTRRVGAPQRGGQNSESPLSSDGRLGSSERKTRPSWGGLSAQILRTSHPLCTVTTTVFA